MKKILLRVDFNAPLKNGKVSDDFRIRAALPTINGLIKSGAQIFLITHLEQGEKILHLDPIYNVLKKLIKTKIRFIRGPIQQKPCDFPEKIILFDNLRLNPGEIKNDPLFAKCLASWGNYYINDAFSVSHRKHASIVLLPKFLPHRAGSSLKKEEKNLSRFFEPKHPFLFILGGKKFSTKEPLISKFIKRADAIFIGGALGNTFLAKRGFSAGKSFVEKIKIPDAILWSNKIFLPEDAIVSRGKKKKTILIKDVEKNDFIYDFGPKTLLALAELSKKARFVLWNGTPGLFESGFAFGTKGLAKALGKSKAFRVVGGGDTVGAIRKIRLEKNFDFISTGGGAMLEFLAKGTLPGIEALKK